MAYINNRIDELIRIYNRMTKGEGPVIGSYVVSDRDFRFRKQDVLSKSQRLELDAGEDLADVLSDRPTLLMSSVEVFE